MKLKKWDELSRTAGATVQTRNGLSAWRHPVIIDVAYRLYDMSRHVILHAFISYSTMISTIRISEFAQKWNKVVSWKWEKYSMRSKKICQFGKSANDFKPLKIYNWLDCRGKAAMTSTTKPGQCSNKVRTQRGRSRDLSKTIFTRRRQHDSPLPLTEP